MDLEQMGPKEVLSLFRDAPWQSDGEIDSLVGNAEPLGVADVLSLLEIFGNPQLAADVARHEMRIAAFSRLAEGVRDKALFVPYVKALRSAEPRLRTILSALIAGVNNISEHTELVGLLRSPDRELRQSAALLLARLGGKPAFDALSEQLAQREFPGRMEAMDAVSAIASHRAIPAFAAVLEVGTIAERIRALALLATPSCLAKDPAGAFGAIANALGDASDAVRVEAISVLASDARWRTRFRTPPASCGQSCWSTSTTRTGGCGSG